MAAFCAFWHRSLLQAGVRDLYAEADLGSFSHSFTSPVRNHGVVVLRISPRG